MNAIVICMASAKGGSGKTTVTAAFASFLSEIGKKVLVIDCDEATHGMTLMYLDQVNAAAKRDEGGHSPYLGIFDSAHYPRRKAAESDEINGTLEDSLNDILAKDQHKPKGTFPYVQVENGFLLVPATYYFSNKPQMESKAFFERLKWFIAQARANFDYIFLDAQAGSDTASRVCLRSDISDEVIIVTEYDPLSAAGVERLKAMMPQDLNFSRTWILLNKMLPEFVKSFSEFLSVARYLPPIPWTADVVRAYSRKRLALDFENGNSYTLGMMQTLKALIPHADALLLDSWSKDKAAALRHPLEEQYSDLTGRLERVLADIEHNEFSGRLYEFISKAIPPAGLAAIVAYVGISFTSSGLAVLDYVLQSSYIVAAVSVLALAAFVVPLYLDTIGEVPKRKRLNRREMLVKQKERLEDEVRRLESLRTADLAGIVSEKAIVSNAITEKR
jgi:cellulose biosynthesis protein BcsQ